MWRGIKWLISITFALTALAALYVSGIWLDLYGRNQPLGTIASTPLPPDTTFSSDVFLKSLPMPCDYDADGNCVKINLCHDGWPTGETDNCLSETEDRA